MELLLRPTTHSAAAAAPAPAAPAAAPAAPAVTTASFFRTIESVHPENMHPANLRAFTININGKSIIISLMGHPIYLGGALSPVSDDDVYFEDLFEDPEEQGISYKDTIRKVQKAGCRIMISFDDQEFGTIRREWLSQGALQFPGGANIHLFDMEDFSAPETDLLDRIYEIALEVSKKGHHLILYCGHGFGRSGVFATSLKIHEIVRRESLAGTLLKKKTLKESIITLIEGEITKTTQIVAEAINFIRAGDPERGHDLKKFNPMSASTGPTVEEPSQIRALERLERRLTATILDSSVKY